MHLKTIIEQNYELFTDWSGTKYIGLTIKWDYKRKEVHVSISGYVWWALTCFQNPPPCKPQHQPHPHVLPNYGQKQQFVEPEDSTPRLNKNTGTFLFYARVVDSTMLTALSEIVSEQAKLTEKTFTKIKQFLDYPTTNPDAIIMYQASNMILAAHSNALYLSEPKAWSKAGGYYFISTPPFPPTMEQCITLHKFWSTSCNWPWKLNWVHSS